MPPLCCPLVPLSGMLHSVTVSTHLPMRPGWNCVGCGAAWPCPSARAQLRAEYDGALVSLAMYLGRCFVEAAEDLPQQPAGCLHERFVGWIRPDRSQAL